MNGHMEEKLNVPVSFALQRIQNRMLEKSHYFGVKALKNPLDFWVYREIIYQCKPDVIIEFGNNWGGSTLALAHIQDLMNNGRVIGCDISHEKIPSTVRQHPRITLIEKPALDAYAEIVSQIDPEESVLIIEDSSHTYANTLGVLRKYSHLIKQGDYFIVEDSICHHGLDVGPDPGPYEAIEAFLSEDDGFEADREMESFFITWNPKGYLRRVR